MIGWGSISGDGHRSFSRSGVSRSDFSCRREALAPMAEQPTHRSRRQPSAIARHLSPGIYFYPLTANRYDLRLSEEPNGLRLHLFMFGVGARRVRRRVRGLIGGLHEPVGQ